VRSPTDLPEVRPGRRRRRIIIGVVIALLIILIISLRSLAGLYTDSLWYSSIGQHVVFSTMLEVKIGLFLTFGLVFFFAMWVNLLLCNRLGPSELLLDAPEDELVRRFQGVVRPYAGRLYALLSVVLALIAASGTVGKWQSYLLFANYQPFGIKDPLFGKDVGFYVFRLPFLTFVVDWVLASLIAIIVFTVIFHYLNGGIRAARVTPRVSPGVKVHLSVLLALLAVAKAAGYLVAKWHMVTSTSGVVEGAGYTDVHARIPALTLLFWLSLAAAVILLVNIRQRGWTLPIIAVGLWAFVALAIGVIYPAVLQALKVTPAQSSLELPYIQRNIAATRAAYNVGDVKTAPFEGTASTSPTKIVAAATPSLTAIRLWDPDPSITQRTFQRLESLRNYYAFSALGEDRYIANGVLTPVVEGVRELNSSGLANQTWVNEHLQFTHGEGLVIAPSNAVQPTNGWPQFDVSNVPPVSTNGFSQVTTPGIYFGLDQNGFTVVNTKQEELNYESSSGTFYSHYKGNGGVPIDGFFRRAMFALRLGDPNILLSNLITSQSRIIFVRNVVQIAQRAAPFLSIDAHPYAVLIGGHIDWVLDGYTTTDQYPYAENANTQLVPSDNGLPGSYNYVRNSVKVIVDAYSGQVTLYAMDPTDPILKAWSSAYPGLIQPLIKMPTDLRAHLKYPADIFSIQAAIYGRYHITNPSAFYNNGDGWSISPTDGAGPPSNTIQQAKQFDSQGFLVSEQAARMDPLYQIYTMPGTANPAYTLTDAYVPASAGNGGSSSSTPVLNLSAFMVALSDPSDYGNLYTYVSPHSGTTVGPVQADSQMDANAVASKQITLLNTNGSQVLLGNVLMVPINGSMLYVRPMYVTSTATELPVLAYVIADYNDKVGFAPTLAGTLSEVFGASAGSGGGSGGSGSGGSGSANLSAAQYLALAQAAYDKAEAALVSGDLGAYQAYVNQMEAYLGKADAKLGSSAASSASHSSSATASKASTTTRAPATATTTARVVARAASRRASSRRDAVALPSPIATRAVR